MAKWGEGDPRWIVEERPDATNVNNWHWTEKNATPWSKERFVQLFKNLKIENENISCEITSVDKMSGDAVVNNRKGKLIFIYEWELDLKWSGVLLSGSKSAHTGKINIPNLSEENKLDEVEITVSVDESDEESEILKSFMYNVGRERVRKQLDIYLKELCEEYSRNIILPKKGEETAATKNAHNNNSSSNLKSSFNAGTQALASNKATTPVGYKLDVRTLIMSADFRCSGNDIYNALTKLDMLQLFTRAEARIEPIKGGEFSLYGGSVHGKFDELVPGQKISQSWRLKTWPSGHYSQVIMEFEQQAECTKMKLTQTGIPAAEFDSMQRNWNIYYWNSIVTTFGFGVPSPQFAQVLST